VPHYWIRVSANPSPPEEIQAAVEAAAAACRGVDLVGTVLFRKGKARCGHATIDCADEAEAEAFTRRIVDEYPNMNAERERVFTAREAKGTIFFDDGGGDADADDYVQAD
jgi:DNA-binding Lrp family transcriptional regulator